MKKKEPFTISGTVQKLMLQPKKKDSVCVGILFTEDEDTYNYTRHIMSLNEEDFSEWDYIRNKFSLSYKELEDIVNKYFKVKVDIFKFRDYRISSMFWLSEPIEVVKETKKQPFEILQKHFYKEVISNPVTNSRSM